MPAPVPIRCWISKQAQNILGLIELIINSRDIDYHYRARRVISMGRVRADYLGPGAADTFDDKMIAS